MKIDSRHLVPTNQNIRHDVFSGSNLCHSTSNNCGLAFLTAFSKLTAVVAAAAAAFIFFLFCFSICGRAHVVTREGDICCVRY